MQSFQKWLMSNGAGLMGTAALTGSVAAGLFVGIAQLRCTLLEEEMAKLKGRLTQAAESLKTEQEANHKAVLGVVNETVKRLAAHLEDARDAESSESAADTTPQEHQGSGVQ